MFSSTPNMNLSVGANGPNKCTVPPCLRAFLKTKMTVDSENVFLLNAKNPYIH